MTIASRHIISLAGCVTDTLEEELAYGMEQLANAPEVMRKRVEETLDLLGLSELRHRALHHLSGGQLQRVAIGAVLTAHPKILVLDEPTSALDPTAAEEVLAAITRLVHDLGVTVVMAEHRLERVVQYADSIVHLPGDGTLEHGDPHELLAGRVSRRRSSSSVAPRVGHHFRCRRATRARRAAPLQARLAGFSPPSAVPPPTDPRVLTLHARGVIVRYGSTVAVRDVDLDWYAGEVVALMGRNGSGKSSLLWALQGAGARQAGRVDVGGFDPSTRTAAEARELVGLVPQTASDLLYLDTVAEELTQADAESRATGPRSRPVRAHRARHRHELAPARSVRGPTARTRARGATHGRAGVILLDEPTTDSTTGPNASSPSFFTLPSRKVAPSRSRLTTWSSSPAARTASS